MVTKINQIIINLFHKHKIQYEKLELQYYMGWILEEMKSLQFRDSLMI